MPKATSAVQPPFESTIGEIERRRRERNKEDMLLLKRGASRWMGGHTNGRGKGAKTG